MKKILFIALVITACLTAKSQELNGNASYIKKNMPEAYENVFKHHALEKWGDDLKMAVYSINKQTNAFSEMMSYFSDETKEFDATLYVKAINNWAYDGYKSINSSLISGAADWGITDWAAIHVDWAMALYTYEKQLKAKNAL